jgi:hypothetical protein
MLIIEDDNSKCVVWTANDPRGNTVILRQDTLDVHILSESKTDKDIFQRRSIVADAKKVVENPRYITQDKDYNINKRENYTDFLSIEGRSGITCLSVVVETDRNPREVVTIIPKRKIGGEGNIVYDSNSDRQKEH